MKNQEINERVAKLCGWVKSVETIEHTVGYQWSEKQTYWSFPGWGRHLRPPNYAESLDACREFMGQIKDEERDMFADEAMHLHRISPLYEYDFWFAIMTLTPLELCECFLKLKGQWDEN